MIYSKVVEMFAEAIPAGILQMYAFVLSPNRSTAAAGSILISALTTGFSSALVSYGEFLWGDRMMSIVEHFSPFMLSCTLQIMTPHQKKDERPLNFMVSSPQLVEDSSSFS